MKYLLNLFLLSFFISSMFSCDSNSGQTASKAQQENRATPPDSTKTQQQTPTDKPVVLFFGNSLTAGYGLDPDIAFPALIQQKIDSLGYDYKVVNAGLSGETTASGNNRLNWVLERQAVDVFVLELGANDGLRGIAPEETQKNLIAMISKVRQANPDTKIILAGMMVPPNMGPEYSKQFQKIFPDIAQEQNVQLIPFLLKDVAGEPELNQADGIHPTAKGEKIVADNVWEVLKDVLEKKT